MISLVVIISFLPSRLVRNPILHASIFTPYLKLLIIWKSNSSGFHCYLANSRKNPKISFLSLLDVPPPPQFSVCCLPLFQCCQLLDYYLSNLPNLVVFITVYYVRIGKFQNICSWQHCHLHSCMYYYVTYPKAIFKVFPPSPLRYLYVVSRASLAFTK